MIMLSIVMPCLNEERNVAQAVREALGAMEGHGIEGEIVAVNDGSTDRTGEILEALARSDHRVRCAHHEVSQGYGGAYWRGVREARGDYVIMIPGDNENDPSESLRYVSLLSDVDILIPFVMNAGVRSPLRRFASSLYRLIVNLSFGTNFNYTNGTVIYKRSLLEGFDLHARGFFYQTELLVRLVRSGYLYAEVPYFLRRRTTGRTKALSMKSLRDVVTGFLWLFWKVHITREIGRINEITDKTSATWRRGGGDGVLRETYESLRAWAGSLHLEMKETDDPRLRVEELARAIAALRLKSLYPPAGPDPEAVRRLVRAYLWPDQNRQIVKGDRGDGAWAVVFEKMVQEAAHEAVRLSENQPYAGCAPGKGSKQDLPP